MMTATARFGTGMAFFAAYMLYGAKIALKDPPVL
jgi:hypothetical protein